MGSHHNQMHIKPYGEKLYFSKRELITRKRIADICLDVSVVDLSIEQTFDANIDSSVFRHRMRGYLSSACCVRHRARSAGGASVGNCSSSVYNS